MTYDQLLEYLKSSSERCRNFADGASDAEAAEALRDVAWKMENAISLLEGGERADRPAEIGAL